MEFKIICAIIGAIYLACLAVSSSANGSVGKGMIYSKWNNGCLDGGSVFDVGTTDVTLNSITSNSTCNNEARVQWQMKSSGELTIKHERFDNGTMCLDCAYGLESCLLVGYACTGIMHQKFSLQTHPNQIDFTNGRFYFSIHSQEHPSKCLTYDDNVGDLIRQHYPASVNVLNPDWHTSFRLANCTGDAKQSFYFKTKSVKCVLVQDNE